MGANKVGEAPNPYKFHSSSGGFGRTMLEISFLKP
jgi:hypothetical protein